MGVFERIASAFSRKQTRARSLARRQAIAPLAIDQQFTRIGGALTPAAVSSIILEADTGYIHRLVDLGNEARQKDCHLQSLLGTREAALGGLLWKVPPAKKPGEVKPQDADRQVAHFVDGALRGAEGSSLSGSRNFTDLISHLSSGVYFSFGTSEIEWKLASGKLIPQGFWPIAHRRFRFSRGNGELVWWDSAMPGTADGVNLHKTFPDKFIIHQPRVNGDVPAREGLIRVLMWAALFRNWGMSDWLKLAEMAWKPWRLGKYHTDASTEEIDDLEESLRRLTSNGIATFSSRAEVSIEWPERGRGGRPEHHDLSEFLGSEMSKAVLGQTLTVDAGERGARSLGEVHDRVRKDIRENDAIAMAATIRRDLIAPLVRLNFGNDTMIPGFHFVTDDAVDEGAYARAVEGLVRSGLEMSQDFVRDRLGIPNPEPGERLLMGQEELAGEQDEEEIEVDVEVED